MAKRHWNRVGDLESLFLRLEELVLANSGADEFDEVFKLIIAKLWDERSGKRARFQANHAHADTYQAICDLLREAQRAWPGILDADTVPLLRPAHLHVCVDALSRHTVTGADLQVLDGFFEYLVSKSSKGAKGQYFTPRPVVELCVRLLLPGRHESACDPGCGSGGFLLHTMQHVRQRENLSAEELRAYCTNQLWGFDIDARAIRVAKALTLIAGDGSANYIRLNSLLRPEMGGLLDLPEDAVSPDFDGESLTIEDVCRGRRRHHSGFDVILTNPPFAGEVRERHVLEGYEIGRGKSRVERDVLFIERCIGLLRPGGRLGIVLPHNKFAGSAFRDVREWLLDKAQLLGIISLPRSTFLPHTHQKASILLARRREKGERGNSQERVFFAISERSGKDSKGRFLYHKERSPTDSLWNRVDHDFDALARAFHATKTGVSHDGVDRSVLCDYRSVAGLGKDVVLAPERYDPRRMITVADSKVTLGEIVELLQVMVGPRQISQRARALVLDTSDAREGIVVCRKAPVGADEIRSAKKVVQRGCVLISRLRPYLRQVAWVDAGVPGWSAKVPLYCSSEFFVMRALDKEPIGFLVPFLLSAQVQQVLAASQEGGHHPRFDRSTLLGLPLPKALLDNRAEVSASVEKAVSLFRRSEEIRNGLVATATRQMA